MTWAATRRVRAAALSAALAGVLSTGTAAAADRVQRVPVDALTVAAPDAVLVALDARLSIIAPAPIRLAVPGSPDVVAVHVQGSLAVVSIVDSEFVRRARPTTNLTLVLEDGGALTVRLTPAARASDTTTDVLRFERTTAFEAATQAAVTEAALHLLAAGGEVAPRVQAALRARTLEAQRLANDAEVAAAAARPPRARALRARTQQGFIYLSSAQTVEVAGALWLDLSLENHSQPDFRPARVRARASESGPWHPDEGVRFALAGDGVPPDGRPRALAVRVHPSDAKSDLRVTEVEVCEAAGGRCVRLHLP